MALLTCFEICTHTKQEQFELRCELFVNSCFSTLVEVSHIFSLPLFEQCVNNEPELLKVFGKSQTSPTIF